MRKHLGDSWRVDRIERISRRLAALVIAIPVVPFTAAPALAEDAVPPPTGTPEEIVVTASKRTESLQTVPISVTALTPTQLAEHQVTDFEDYAKLVPSLSYQSFGPSQSQINFRGITTGGDGLASGPLPTVGVYVDETPVTTINNSLDMHVYDMERIEALTGPQGTLYGASSLAGTLRMITKKPVIGKWEGGVDAGASKYGPGAGGGSLESYLNIPITNFLAARVMAFAEHDGGYISNTPTVRTYQRPHFDASNNLVDSPLSISNGKYAESNANSADSYGGRAMLKVNLDENWTLMPALIVQKQLTRGSFLTDPHLGDLQVHDFIGDFNKDDWELASMTLQGKVSDWDLTYNAAYLSRRIDNISDYSYFTVAYDQLAAAAPASYAGYTYLTDSMGRDIDPTQIIHQHDSYTKQSHELRISSPASNRWRATAGLYFQRQTNSHVADYRVPGLATATNAFSPPLPGAPQDDAYYTDLYRVDRDFAIFTQDEFDITKQLTLLAGIRGFVAYNTLTGFSGSDSSLNHAAAVKNCPVVTVFACPNVDASYRESGETHMVGLKWQVDPTRMYYFTYSTGFRPGGVNRSVYTNGKYQIVPPFKADTLTNYELGWKTSWLDRKLFINGALFWDDWNNTQYSLPGVLGIFYTVNAGNARSRGLETQVTWKATPNWTLSLNGTWLNSRLTAPFCDQVNGCNPAAGGRVFAPEGTRTPMSPRLKLNGNAKYTFEWGKYDAYIQGGFNSQSNTTSQLREDWEAIVGPNGGFTTFDLSAGLLMDKYTLTLYGNNVTDERGVVTKNSQCAPSICGANLRDVIVKPQQFGLKVGYKF